MSKNIDEKLLSFEDTESENNDLENLNELTKIAERKKWLEEFKTPNSEGTNIFSYLGSSTSHSHIKERANEECTKYKSYENVKGEYVIINTLNYKPLADETGEYIFRSVSFWYYDGFGFYIEHRKNQNTWNKMNCMNFVNFDGKLFFKKDIYAIKKAIFCEDDDTVFICFRPLRESHDYIVNQTGDVYRFLKQYNIYSLKNIYSTSKEFLSMFEAFKTSLNVNDEDFLNKIHSFVLEAKEMNEKLLSFEDTEIKDNDLENFKKLEDVTARKKEFEENWEYFGDERYECNDLYRRIVKYKKNVGSKIIDTCNFLINNGSYEILFPLTDEYQFHRVSRLTYLGPKYNLYAARVSRIIKDKTDPLNIRPRGGVAFFEYNIVFNDGTFLFPKWLTNYYISPEITTNIYDKSEEPFFIIRSSETGITFRFYFNGDIVDITRDPVVKLPKDMTIEQYCKLNSSKNESI